MSEKDKLSKETSESHEGEIKIDEEGNKNNSEKEEKKIILDDDFINIIAKANSMSEVIKIFKDSYDLELTPEQIDELFEKALENAKSLGGKQKGFVRHNKKGNIRTLENENLDDINGGADALAVIDGLNGICSLATNIPNAIDGLSEAFKKIKGLLKEK